MFYRIGSWASIHKPSYKLLTIMRLADLPYINSSGPFKLNFEAKAMVTLRLS